MSTAYYKVYREAGRMGSGNQMALLGVACSQNMKSSDVWVCAALRWSILALHCRDELRYHTLG